MIDFGIQFGETPTTALPIYLEWEFDGTVQ